MPRYAVLFQNRIQSCPNVGGVIDRRKTSASSGVRPDLPVGLVIVKTPIRLDCQDATTRRRGPGGAPAAWG